tara:strand:- start:1226 stop:2416 length:1191 start_codon:yes stop_codon:yes gene_type:complete
MDYLGAGSASKKIFSMLRKEDVDVDLFVKKKNSGLSKKIELSKVDSIKSLMFDLFNYGSNKFLNNNYSRKFNPYHKSLGWFSSPYPKIINSSNYDIVQLNWINNFLSIRDIVEIKKPIIWRFSDMWPILGISHYEYKNMNYNLYSIIEDYNYKRKQILRDKKLNIITPSNWMKTKIENKSSNNNWKISTIYTPVDQDIFKPLDINEIKKIKKQYEINSNQKVLCFCADNINEKRKGLERIIDVFKNNLISGQEFTLFTIGKGKTKFNKYNNLNIKNLGFINSQAEVNKIYNISDLLLLFSDIDNLPQVGIEAQSSGLPVLTFNHSGLSEIIENYITGIYVEDTLASISSKIENFFKDTAKISMYKSASRERSLKIWSNKVIFKKYLNLYSSILSEK